MRERLTAASKDWQSLTQNQILFWKNYIGIYKDWYIGSSENVSPFNAFMSVATQIKNLIEVTGHTTIINTEDWDQDTPTYDKTVTPGPKPPIFLQNIEGFGTDVSIKVENGITVASIKINITNNTMSQGDYLQTIDNRKATFVLWLSNPGKYITSNMKPMVQKILATGILKIKKPGSQVTTIEAKVNIATNYYKLVPQLGEYVVYTLGLQTVDGPFTIVKQGTKQVISA
jgi:hypothetical protein